MGRLVVISNRLADPRKTASGGLAVALGQALESSGGLWFGWSGKIVEDGTPGEGDMHLQQAGKVQLATVDLSREDHDSYYLGYSNGVLWPVFHYRLDLADFDAGYIGGYRRVNQMFAHKLASLLQARRRHLGARLPPDPAGRRAARHGLQAAHGLLPAHPAAATR
jgi:trehalose 6-phosphate synthase